VYRSYDGVGGCAFELNRHMGRYALAAGDLLRMGLTGRHFEVVAAFCPARSGKVLVGGEAYELVREKEGKAA
jgi:hypothetical protein